MADLRISELPVLQATDAEGIDELPIADRSTNITRRLSLRDLGSAVFGTIGTGTLPGTALVSNSVTALQLAPDSVTSSELADGAVDTQALQALSVTDSKIAPGVSGAKLTDGTVTAAKLAASALDRGLNNATGAIGHANAITAGTTSGITYDAQGHITAAVALGVADLPVGTATTRGALSVGAGLAVTPAGSLSIAHVFGSGTARGLTWNDNGMLTNVGPLPPADLPTATATVKGAAYAPAAGGLSIAADGALTLPTTGITPGSYPKVTVNSRGIVTAGASLLAADIPDIDAAKIISGTLPTARLADQSVTAQKLADYALAYIQEAVPPAGVNAHPIGMTWLQESTGQVSVWNGNSWMKTGASTLFNKNLRYCGTYDATTGKVTGVTQFGTAEGFKVGDAIPAADDQHAGCYFVASTGGTNASIASGATFDAGDWLLCQGTTSGWVRIDTLNGSGGGSGGGASNLDDLLDATITAPKPGDVLHYTAAGQWVNVPFLEAGTY